jgi:hypothetical protein
MMSCICEHVSKAEGRRGKRRKKQEAVQEMRQLVTRMGCELA